MYNNLHFYLIVLHSKPVEPKFEIRKKTYLPKGHLILVIPGLVSIDHVHYQTPQLFSTGHAVVTLKVEIEAVRIEK